MGSRATDHAQSLPDDPTGRQLREVMVEYVKEFTQSLNEIRGLNSAMSQALGSAVSEYAGTPSTTTACTSASGSAPASSSASAGAGKVLFARRQQVSATPAAPSRPSSA